MNIDPTFEMQGITKVNNSLRLNTVALACERTGISDRKAAIIASAVPEDFGIISAEIMLKYHGPKENRESEKKTKVRSLG